MEKIRKFIKKWILPPGVTESINHIIARNKKVLWLGELRFRWRIYTLAHSSPKPVFIYQMGKVGSSSIMTSLEKYGIKAYQIHVMNFPKGKAITPGFKTAIKHGWYVNKKLIKPRYPLKIITLVREPIGRNISAYFENLNAIWQANNAHKKVCGKDLIEGFLDKYEHSVPLCWFDREFNEVLGLNVYEHEFPHELGYLNIKTAHYDILILQAELEDKKKEECIANLLEIEDFSLSRGNVGSKKEYAEQYNDLLKTIILPDEYIHRMLDSKYAKHFFSGEQIEKYKCKWSR